MKIPEVEKLRQHVEGGGTLPVVLVEGGDEGVHAGIEEVLKLDLEKSCGSVSVTRLDAKPPNTDAWKVLADTADNAPMFGEGFLLAVSNCNGAEVSGELEAFLQAPAGHVRLALYGDRKVAKSGLGKAVAKVGKVVAPKDLREREATRLAHDLAREAGIRLGGKSSTVLADLTGGDRGAIKTAIRMLREFRGEGATIGEDDIAGLVSRTGTPAPWDLDDAIMARDLRKAVKVASRLVEDRASAIPVLFTISRLVRRMLVARDLVRNKVPDDEAMKRLKINHPFPWKKLRESSGRYTDAELARFLKDLPRLETLVKRDKGSGEAILVAALARLVPRGR